MSKTNDTKLDTAEHGGGIGDIGRQAVDPSTENSGASDPAVTSSGDDETGVGLSIDEDAAPSGEDPDDEADETLGTVV